MIDERFVLLGFAISLVGTLRYCRLTLLGRVIPNRVSWFLWTLVPLIGFCAQLSDGVGWPAVLTLSIGVGPGLVFLAACRRGGGRWVPTAIDRVCAAVAAVAIAAWLVSGSAGTAVLLTILADAVAAVPTIVKAWRAPWTEYPLTFALGGINGVLTVATISDWRPQVWAFPVYVMCLGMGLCSLVIVRSRVTTRARQTPHPPPGSAPTADAPARPAPRDPDSTPSPPSR